MKEREESRLRLVAELKGGLDAEEESVLEQELAMQLNNTQDMKKYTIFSELTFTLNQKWH